MPRVAMGSELKQVCMGSAQDQGRFGYAVPKNLLRGVTQKGYCDD